jgi:hypothetical protein
MLIDHHHQVRSYGQYFDQVLKVLVFDTMDTTKTFATLTEDPVIIVEIVPNDESTAAEEEAIVSGKALLNLISHIVFSEGLHRFDTIVVLPSELASQSPNKKKGGSSLVSLSAQDISMANIKIHLHQVNEQSPKLCSLTLREDGSIDVENVLTCLSANLRVLTDELGLSDSSSLGDERGGSSKYTRNTYALVQNTLQ